MARMGEEREVYRVLLGKPEGRKPFGRPRHRWDDGIRINLRDTDWGVKSGFSWIKIGPVAGSCKYGDEPSGSGAM
jgi:hypothetical protein